MENSLNGEFILNENTSVKGQAQNNGQLSQLSTPKEDTFSPDKQQKINAFSSFCHYPGGVTFQDQEANETIILLLRRHFVTNIPWIFLSLILLILPLFFSFLKLYFPLSLPSGHILTLYLASYYVIIAGFILLNFTLWYFQAGLATTLRVIDVDINGLLFREVSEARIDDIQDVSYQQSGFIRSLFNYGDVLVQTSGSIQNVEFDRIPRPSTAARIIGDLTKNNG